MGGMSERIVVIGGNAAGMTAASRAKRLRPDLEIAILESSHFISYSICGLPYYVSDVVARHEDLITFSPERLKAERGIEARTRVWAEEVRPGKRTVACREMDADREFEVSYDRLVIATGYVPRSPNIEGMNLDGVLSVSRLEDGIRIRHEVEKKGHKRIAIIGAGYIGLMMAHGLRSLGLEVLLVEKNRHVFSQVDEDMAELIEEELRRNGVRLVLGTPVRRLLGTGGVLEAVEIAREKTPVDLALVDVGILPNTELAERSGIPLGVSGAVQVDERGHTAVSSVYAAGNCAETVHLVSGSPLFSGLGTTAAKQGRVVGENLVGLRSTFRGTLETSIEKVFDLAVARTGLTQREALKAGFDADEVRISGHSRAGYYPESRKVWVKLIFERRTGRLLGGQVVGDESAGKRIDVLVAALTARMSLHDLAQLDLAYAPPFGTLWDPFQVAANVALRKLER